MDDADQQSSWHDVVAEFVPRFAKTIRSKTLENQKTICDMIKPKTSLKFKAESLLKGNF